MTKLVKVALIAFLSGLIIIFFACGFGMLGIEPVATIMLIIGAVPLFAGVLVGWVAAIIAIWNE